MNCGQPLSVGLKCDRNSPCGSVRRVPKNIALTAGLSSRYASSACRMGNAYRLRSRRYCSADVATNSSTSGNGSRETMYIAWSDRSFAVAAPVERGGSGSGVGGVGRLVAASSEPGDGRGAVSGRQASIKTKRTRQSLPPLYESERCSCLFFCELRVPEPG